MQFDRHRRLRSSKSLRNMVSETHVRKEDLIYPIFVVERDNVKEEIKSLPGVYQLSLNVLDEEIKEAYDLGIRGIMFFGVPNEKDAIGTGAFDHNGIVQEATRKAKAMYSDLMLSQTLVYVEYDHGHLVLLMKNEQR